MEIGRETERRGDGDNGVEFEIEIQMNVCK
jgi:hypothetical protein